jgi:hypothetical protein
MRRLYIRLDAQTLQALNEAARTERRHPSDHVALLVERALCASGDNQEVGRALEVKR